MQNRKFTWSNEQSNQMMSKLDSFFCNEDWDIEFATHILHALSSSVSDHCPLLLANGVGPKKPKSFRFENFWTKMRGFQRVFTEAWNENSDHIEPYQRIFHKLKRIGQKLSSWRKTLVSNSRSSCTWLLSLFFALTSLKNKEN